MEQKKSERAARGSNAWQPQARQQELDEADKFQVPVLWFLCIPPPVLRPWECKTKQTASIQLLLLCMCWPSTPFDTPQL